MTSLKNEQPNFIDCISAGMFVGENKTPAAPNDLHLVSHKDVEQRYGIGTIKPLYSKLL